jgi:hypothetical protein
MFSFRKVMKDDIYPIWRDVDDHIDQPDGVDFQ